MTLLLDTHALVWWSAKPEELSEAAARLLASSDELAVSAISWWEIAWAVRRGRISPKVPLGAWLRDLGRDVRTVAITPAIAATAAALPDTFPGDPGDRLIYATAVENGWRLATKDSRMRAHDREGAVVVW